MQGMSMPARTHTIDGVEIKSEEDGRRIRKRYRAADLPMAIARDREVPRAEQSHLKQFCRDWRHWPGDREWMLDGVPDSGSDPYDLAKVAALVRGLCDRWGQPSPRWIEGVRAPIDIILFLNEPVDLDDPWDRALVEDAPPACAQHGVYYQSDLLEFKRDVLARVVEEGRSASKQAKRRDGPAL